MAYPIKNEIGKKYGHLTVLEITPMREKYTRCVVWKCKCDCGKIHYVAGYNLRFGKIRTCGRCNKEE